VDGVRWPTDRRAQRRPAASRLHRRGQGRRGGLRRPRQRPPPCGAAVHARRRRCSRPAARWRRTR
jgi:hypothetical protein